MSLARWYRRGRGSVRLRVALLAAGLFAVTLAVVAFALLWALERALVDDLRSDDRAALQQQATQVFTQGLPVGAVPVAAEEGTAFALPATGAQRVVLIAPSGDVLTRVAPDELPEQIVYSAGVPMASAELLGIDGDPGAFDVSALSVGGVVLATASPLDAVRETIATTRRLMWVVGPALVALVAGLAWLLAGRALRPVHAVTSRVAAIGSHSLYERVPVPPSSDEIAELARTMNGMLGRLESGDVVQPAARLGRLPRTANSHHRDARRARGRPPVSGTRLGRDDRGAAR